MSQKNKVLVPSFSRGKSDKTSQALGSIAPNIAKTPGGSAPTVAPRHNLKPHISPSQLESYTRCGEAYRRRYLLKEVIPPAVALIQGTSVHKSAEDNFKQKIETKEDLKKSIVIEKAAAAFEGILKNEGIWLTPEEEAAGKTTVLGQAKDRTVNAAGAFIDKIAPLYQPKEVEVEQRISMPKADYDLMGRVDLITSNDEIQDLKTGRKKLSQADVDSNTQFSFYDLTYRAKHGKPPRATLIDQIVSAKNGVRINRLKTKRNSDDLQALVNRLNTMISGLKTGVFMPATPGAWWCSPNFCGYYRTCSYVNSGKRPT